MSRLQRSMEYNMDIYVGGTIGITWLNMRQHFFQYKFGQSTLQSEKCYPEHPKKLSYH